MNASEARKPQGCGKGFYTNSQKPNIYYTFCHRNNHTIDLCYLKHGHPSVPKQQSRVNVASNDVYDASSLVDHGPDSSTSSTSGLSQEQYAQLVSLLQQASLVPPASTPSNLTTNHIQASPLISTSIIANASETAGIPLPYSFPQRPSYLLLDSGANENICFNLSHFTSFYKIKPVCVGLPNCTSVIVHYAGNVAFTSHFYLTNVLRSLVFNLNLISVAKLCQSLQYV